MLKLKKILCTLIIFIVITSSVHVFAAENGLNEKYDFSNPEFKETVSMLNMEGHSNDSLATCNVKQMYYNEVAEMFFKKGMTKQEILNYYEKEQGEQALTAPTVKGFNIILWVAPFLLIFLVSGILYIAIKKWKRNRTVTAAVKEDDLETKDLEYDLYLPLIEEERKNFL